MSVNLQPDGARRMIMKSLRGKQSMAMDPLEAARIRKVIEDRLDELSGEITDKLGDAATVTADLDRAADAGDRSVVDDVATGDFADARRDVLEFQAGRDALARLDAGEYGICVDCGTDIPVARLHAQPFAARCIACQERVERSTGFQPRTM
jgi:DnaK suppressor protein